MKDIYDYLNDVQIDVDRYDEEAVSDTDKKRLIRSLQQKMIKQPPSRWKKSIMAASISAGLLSASLFGLSFTSFAQELPVIGLVYKLFSSDRFVDGFNENANVLSLSQEENGVKMVINEAVFDGKTLYITYDLFSKKDLGESPQILGLPNLPEGLHEFIVSGNHDIKKVNGTHYAGITQATLYTDHRVEKGSFNFIISGIQPDEGIDPIKVNWNFQFDLHATDNQEQLVDLKSDKNDVTVTVKRIVYTPMSFLIFYNEVITTELLREWDFISIDIIVKDDLGHIYENEHNGGFGLTHVRHTSTFEKLHPDATRLIVTPILKLAQKDGTNENGNIYRNIGSTAPKEEIILDDIVIEIEK
ncbi:DUF4179 domain-containing protein [Sporosarcina cyprini]|uniref:DUF4179 domain-containing protein n=1 Tax=Sporosarcina cyprini TaxID=2910523 RepID=UPI001EE0C2FC|nr:DUF4179 domain-containing protein [Sporosarcina cyprini]MCG3087286.1 DUF4179 domain-containing protein [Sporosarcina cyprini]